MIQSRKKYRISTIYIYFPSGYTEKHLFNPSTPSSNDLQDHKEDPREQWAALKTNVMTHRVSEIVATLDVLMYPLLKVSFSDKDPGRRKKKREVLVFEICNLTAIHSTGRP